MSRSSFGIKILAARYKEEMEAAQRGLERVQSQCKHPYASKVARSDTGNWDKSDDSYWYDCVCPDCGKKWQEDQ
jgi:hypothetical protein